MSEPSPSLLDPHFLRLLERISYMLRGRIRATRAGERRSTRRGQGTEFADHRAYAVGDDLRHLDWHLMARLDSLFIRMYEEPREHTVQIVLDVSASMGVGKGDYVRRLAAALAYIALCGGDRVGLFVVRDRLEGTLGPLRSKQGIHRVFQYLDGLEFGGQTDLERSIQDVVKASSMGTVVLISDFLVPTGRMEALRSLANRRLRTLVLHVLSHEERMPVLGQELTLLDAESGEELTVTVDKHVRQAYLAELSALTSELKDYSTRLGFTFVEVDTSTPLVDLILGDLRKHGVVASPG